MPRPPPASPAPPRAIAVACSTGGPAALARIFCDLAAALGERRGALPPIFVTQHMPVHFTGLLAGQIAAASGFDCAEATQGSLVRPGRIYIAPGDYHMTVGKDSGTFKIKLLKSPPVHFCRPAADPMLQSLAEAYGENLLAVILTGMGKDGLTGCRKIIAAGGTVLAQDAASSTVWGMPGAVVGAGCAQAVLPLEGIAGAMARWLLSPGARGGNGEA